MNNITWVFWIYKTRDYVRCGLPSINSGNSRFLFVTSYLLRHATNTASACPDAMCTRHKLMAASLKHSHPDTSTQSRWQLNTESLHVHRDFPTWRPAVEANPWRLRMQCSSPGRDAADADCMRTPCFLIAVVYIKAHQPHGCVILQQG